LFERMITTESVPVPASLERRILSGAVMFQEGRTVTTVEHANHLANEFGKGILRKSFEREGKSDLLEFLPKVKITMPDAVMDAIGQHLAMSMLIDDLDCTLFLNRTNEDFLTSDHPVALCNSLPSSSPFATSGFASRGLIIALPLSPRALVLLTDAEVYKVAKSEHGALLVTSRREVVDLNLAQCFKAHENLYFASLAGVQETLDVFEKRKDVLRRKAAPYRDHRADREPNWYPFANGAEDIEIVPAEGSGTAARRENE
jgi:Protein of unknown function (DUF4238)